MKAIKTFRSACCVVAYVLASPAFAGEDLNTAIGGAAGGVAGTILGEQFGGQTGALAGAAIGGALGGAATANHGNKNEAALGGAVGALGGAAIGNQMVDSHRSLVSTIEYLKAENAELQLRNSELSKQLRQMMKAIKN